MNPAPNLFFIGPTGAGKSTVGARVARRLGLPFHDLDDAIRAHTGADPALIFDLEGEAGFRRRESALLAALATGDGLALATGAGAVLDQANRDLLRRRGFVVWLDADVETQLARLGRDRQRPLLSGADLRARLTGMAATRTPLYAALADLHITPRATRGTDALASDIAELVGRHWRRTPAGPPE